MLVLRLDLALNARNLIECCPGGYLRMIRRGEDWGRLLKFLFFSWESSIWFSSVGILDWAP